MSDMIGDLIAANPELVKPVDAVPIKSEDGGVQVYTPGHKPADEGAAPTVDANALVNQLVKALKPPEAPLQLGERLPVETRDGSRPGQPVKDEPAAAPVPAQAAPPADAASSAPAPAPSVDVTSLATQLAEAKARLVEAQQHAAWRAQNEPILNAVREKWPYIQGLEQKVAEKDAKLAETEAKAEFEALKARHIQESLEAGLKPNVAELERQWKMDRALNRAMDADKRVEEKLNALFNERDLTYQAQVKDAQEKAYLAQVQQHFRDAWAQIETEVPAVKGRDALKRLVWSEWTYNVQQPVKAVLKPYLDELRVQAVAAQAPQVAKAEVHARMPVTVNGGSGAAANATPQRPKNWDRMGFQERLAYNMGRR